MSGKHTRTDSQEDGTPTDGDRSLTDPTADIVHLVDTAQLVETAPCGILVVDADSEMVLYVNSTLLDVVGRNRNDIVNTVAAQLFTDDSVETLSMLIAAAASTDGPPIGAPAALHIPESTAGLPVSLMANRHHTSTGGAVVTISVHSNADRLIRESALVSDRDIAHAAQVDAEAALGRTQLALGESEDARKTAEAERTQIQLLATTLQRTLLPPVLSAPTGLDVAGFYHPASLDEVGGDFYDVFPLDAVTWGFFLGDVSGKGAGAAAVTSLTRYTLRAAAVFDRDPIAVLENLNTVLHHEFRGDDPRFCTVIYGTITPTETGAVIRLASGGHPPALHLRADGTADYVHTHHGQLVGAFADAHFTSASITLKPGDVLALYTDGLTEAVTGPGRAATTTTEPSKPSRPHRHRPPHTPSSTTSPNYSRASAKVCKTTSPCWPSESPPVNRVERRQGRQDQESRLPRRRQTAATSGVSGPRNSGISMSARTRNEYAPAPATSFCTKTRPSSRTSATVTRTVAAPAVK
ncbi:PP2C family protein-serine/threonine phosphatase [Rhodococcoides kyotonense]|uniref:Sigma-B regulation protein RsbU (Phosphoserine phosphatase) n=1 Tax=Rhodococcoides kyotonense TaxID=398843 RepID=A0A239ETT5_9NOCA|nr:SpoIIE family protein phosphatase [Rhodococcus kyotonensis]SNS47264.1 sigma-B regulation protein RsbU (phosphoserine phosphatase) [Rhodococcus kyotonensis]